MSTATPRYAAPAIALHWLSAGLVAAGFALGLAMVELPFGPEKFRWYAWHKWIGITAFGVALLRIAWRAACVAPAALPLPLWQRRAAAGVHLALYLLLLAIPLSGWLYSSAAGVQVVWFGVVPLPDLVAKDRALATGLKAVHHGLNFALATLVFVHAGAALWHHFVDRDAVLARMLPRRRRPR